MQAIFGLPTVHNDCSSDQSLRDMLHSLQRLDDTVSSVFSRVMLRAQHEKSRVADVKSRILAARKKIRSISTNSTRATTIFSTSKHPASQTIPNYNMLFSSSDPLKGVSPYLDADPETLYTPADPNMSDLNNNELTRDLTDLFTRLNPGSTDMIRVEIMMENEGVGALPKKVDSVASLLLFNSTKCPYNEYIQMNNLVGTDFAERSSTTDRKNDLHHAPSTLLDGDLLPDVAAMDLTFKPELGQMASLALPCNMPLPNIADIQFGGGGGGGENGASMGSIAPSNFQAATQLTLPAIEFAAAPTSKESSSNNNNNNNNNNNSNEISKHPPTTTSAPPPPPPPSNPPPAVTTAEHKQTAIEQAPDESDENDDSGGGGGGGMGDLLSAIKGKGVGGLKKAAERIVAERKVEKTAEKPSMFNELQKSMARRQMAISGKKDRLEKKRETFASTNPEGVRQQIRSSLSSLPKASLLDIDVSSDDSCSDNDGRDRNFSDTSWEGNSGPPKNTKQLASSAPASGKSTKFAPEARTKERRKHSASNKTSSLDEKHGDSSRDSNPRRGSLWDNENPALNKMLSRNENDNDDADNSDGSADSAWD